MISKVCQSPGLVRLHTTAPKESELLSYALSILMSCIYIDRENKATSLYPCVRNADIDRKLPDVESPLLSLVGHHYDESSEETPSS